MNIFKYTLFILVFSINHAFAENIDMFVGEVKVFGTVMVNRVAVGRGQVIRAEVLDSGELLVIAESAGSSSLRLWNEDATQTDYNIRVVEKDPEKRVRMESMINMRVKLVEFRKNSLGQLGIDWQTNINGLALSTVGDFHTSDLFRSPGNSGIDATLPLSVSPFSTHFGIATSITSRINYLAANGDAALLAEPNLSCINGGSAKFLAGGEIPYPVTGNFGQTIVEFKEYGIKLEISPLADPEGNIYTRIMTEVSQIDPAVQVLGVPGLLTRRTETEVNVVAGDTIVISGLLNAETSKSVDMVAGLGDLPVLGPLFRSTDYRSQLTELVVFITPEVRNPYHPQVSSREQSLLEQRDGYLQSLGAKLDYNIMD